MNLEKLFLSAFSTCMLFSSTKLYAEQKGVVHGHLYEVSYPTNQPKDTLGRPTLYMPEAKSDLDRKVEPGLLPQYLTPNNYGYKELKYKTSTSTNTNSDSSTPHFGEKVSKRRATKNTFDILHPDGIYHYRDGIFYLQNNDKYEIHEPHIGFRVPSIPSARREFTSEGISYYYYYGTFYVLNPDVKMYDVVEPPVGALVDWIPSDAEKRVIDGDQVYVAKGIQYKETSLVVGTQKWYQVVGK